VQIADMFVSSEYFGPLTGITPGGAPSRISRIMHSAPPIFLQLEVLPDPAACDSGNMPA
jgi:hypothetical protein